MAILLVSSWDQTVLMFSRAEDRCDSTVPSQSKQLVVTCSVMCRLRFSKNSALLARQWIHVSASVHGALAWNFQCFLHESGDFVASTGSFIITTLVPMKKMMNKAIVRDFVHVGSAIDLAFLEDWEGMKVICKPQSFFSSSPFVTV